MTKTAKTLLAGLLVGAFAASFSPGTAAANFTELHETAAPDYMHYSCWHNQQIVAQYMLAPEDDAAATPEDRNVFCSMETFGNPDHANEFINDHEWDPWYVDCGPRLSEREFAMPFVDGEGNEVSLVETRVCRVDTQIAQSQVTNEPFCDVVSQTEQCVVVDVRIEAPGYNGAEAGCGCTSDADCPVGYHCHENQGPNGTCAKDGT